MAHDVSHLPNRRTIARGAAWSAPAIAIGVAAPSASASTTQTPPGLQGWVLLSKQCSMDGMRLTIDGIGDYPNRGLWVFNTTPSTSLAGASITFYLPSDLKLQWHTMPGSSGWSTPVASTSAAAISNLTAYTTSYTGPWVYVAGSPSYSYAAGQPKFEATVSNRRYCTTQKLASYAYRSIVVNGKAIDFRRGPIEL